jgi:hypothetical protein
MDDWQNTGTTGFQGKISHHGPGKPFKDGFVNKAGVAAAAAQEAEQAEQVRCFRSSRLPRCVSSLLCQSGPHAVRSGPIYRCYMCIREPLGTMGCALAVLLFRQHHHHSATMHHPHKLLWRKCASAANSHITKKEAMREFEHASVASKRALPRPSRAAQNVVGSNLPVFTNTCGLLLLSMQGATGSYLGEAVQNVVGPTFLATTVLAMTQPLSDSCFFLLLLLLLPSKLGSHWVISGRGSTECGWPQLYRRRHRAPCQHRCCWMEG